MQRNLMDNKQIQSKQIQNKNLYAINYNNEINKNNIIIINNQQTNNINQIKRIENLDGNSSQVDLGQTLQRTF